MRKQYKRVLASAMAAILIWNTCGWQVPALAASVVYQVEEIEQLPEEVLYQEVPYGTKYKDLELPDKLKMLVLTEDEETWDEEADETIKTATSSDADDIYSGEDWKMLRSAGCCAKIAVKKKHMMEKLRVSMYSMRS